MHSEDKKVEEILSSIRTIISEDMKDHTHPSLTGPSQEHGRVKRNADPVLELTQMVDKDGSIVTLTKPKSEQDRSTSSPHAGSYPKEEIISSSAAQEFISAFDNLHNTLKPPQPSPQSTPSFNKESVGEMTLEMIIHQMLQPLLKEWLDKHLPSLVKLLVSEQIEKIVNNKQQ